MGSTTAIWNKFEKWCRLVILLQEGGESVCKHILHTELGVPTDGGGMYKYLQKYEVDIKRTVKYGYQKKILLPANGHIDETKLDIPLFCYIIQILDKNKNYPSIENLRYMRNDLFHMEGNRRNMSEQEFNDQWDKAVQLLNGLNFGMSLLNSLKSDDLVKNQQYKMTLDDILKTGKVRYILLDVNNNHISKPSHQMSL